jgi:hypothetical protein
MKVVVRTLGRDASVTDWLTKLFQAIIVSPSVAGVDTVMVVSGRGAAPERLIPLQSDCCQVAASETALPRLRRQGFFAHSTNHLAMTSPRATIFAFLQLASIGLWLRANESAPELDIVVEMELVRMRTQPDSVDLLFPLVVEPGFDHVGGKHIAA